MEILVKVLIWTYREIKKSDATNVVGEHEVRIRLTQNKDIKYISVGFSSSKENWNEETNMPTSSHPHSKKLTQKITNLLDEIDFELRLAIKEKRTLTPIELKRKVLHEEEEISVARPQLKILEYFDLVISKLEEDNNPGYADIFTSTKSTVSKLLHGRDKGFLDFTKEDHIAYEKVISKDTSESTISVYLRTYYRIWNLAIADGYCSKDEHHPSKYIKFKAYKTIRTKKRSIDKSYLGEIMKLDFSNDSRKYRHHLYMQFMYYTRGLNFGDMCKLKWSQIANGGIQYTRSKNKRDYDFILHKKSLAVLEIFKNYPIQSDSGNVFPILFSIHDTARKVDQRIESALKDFNEDIKEMGEDVGWKRKFTSYSLRHGFATHLRNSGVGIAAIQKAMGHELERQTNVYLDDIDDQPIAEEIDRALDFD